FTCADVLAGIRSCTLPVTLSTEGADQSVTGTAEDRADNTAGVTVGNISIDKTAPIITASRSPVANSYGWNNGAVEVSFICDDALSGVDSCTGSMTLGDEGAGQSVTGLATDKANNSASNMVGGINIDLTAPTITHTIIPDANSNGWHNADVIVRFEASETLSGIDGASTQDMVFTLEGSGQTTGDIAFTDKAGNSASDSVSGISIDKTAPSVSISGIASGAEFIWGDSIPAAVCNAADGLSGMDSCILTMVPNNGNVGEHTISAKATDKAGNVATTSISYTIKAWTLRGFYQPVDMGTVLNTVKGGQTVPMKFEVFAGTAEKTSISDISSFTQKKISCSNINTAMTDDVELTTTGNTALRYDSTSGQFIANWKTPTGQAGTCWEAKMTSLDGSIIVGFFKLK
ncbi:MAG: PxKF domain-containing protein, partial [Nitrososphaera sp.]|uniref:PxKF domain-containing protein n=1 Tax=Nitrososphaera sp. TaxID=1971748 RepID=UPI003D6FDF25